MSCIPRERTQEIVIEENRGARRGEFYLRTNGPRFLGVLQGHERGPGRYTRLHMDIFSIATPNPVSLPGFPIRRPISSYASLSTAANRPHVLSRVTCDYARLEAHM